MNLSRFIIRLFRFCIFLTFFTTFYFISHTNDDRFINEDSLQSVFFSDQQQFKQRYNRANNQSNNRWIVVTTISHPTKDIRQMAELENWNIVIVADKKTPKNWNYKNCIFLSLEQQLKLNYDILKFIPYNSYTRKIIGYLYAIERGAKFIYDTDDDNLPIRKKLEAFDYSKYTTSLIHGENYFNSKPLFFNVYSHFGRSDIWPRGFPLEFINQENANRNLNLCTKTKTPIIQQGLVDQDADVDAVYRMIYVSNKIEGLNVKFDPIVPPIVLARNSFCPYNSQNTLFHYKAFWSLLLPVTVTFRVTDIWRSYWSQRLLHLIEDHLGFVGPNARQNRNAHNYFKDFIEEIQMYTNVSKLVTQLQMWKCRKNQFSDCIIDLSKFMFKNGFWDDEDYQLTKAWINDLKKMKYNFPHMASIDNNSTSVSLSLNNSCDNADYVSQTDKQINAGVVQMESLKTFNRWCHPFLLNKLQYSGFSETIYDHTKNVILIVTFNHRHFEQIPILQYLYGPWFANVIYCASFPDDLKFKSKKFLDLKSKISFINLKSDELFNGYFGYVCLKKVADMQIRNADGYLVISDDMLLNFWNPYDLTKVHMHDACEKVGTKGNGWQWWNSSYGEPALINLQQSLKSISTVDIDSEILYTLSEILMIPIWCASDIYYVPRHLLTPYQILSDLFFQHQVFLEIAIPKILSALGWANRYKQVFVGMKRNDADFSGKYLWELKERGNPFNYYDKNEIFLHPLKMSLFDQPVWRSGFCNTYITSLFDAISRRSINQ